MNKKQRHTPEEIKKYTAAMREFCMPALLNPTSGIKKPAADNELEMLPIGGKTEEKIL